MTLLRQAWYCAAWSHEVGRQPLARTILGEKVVMFRKEDGESLVALSNVCPHRFSLMDGGKLRGDTLACPYHGLRFDSTGACVRNPHGDIIPPTLRLKSYQLIDRYGAAWIWMGDAEAADPALIPEFAEQTDPRHRTVRGMIPVKGSYELVSDNLLDLSHTQYLHELLKHEHSDQVTQSFEIVQTDDMLETFHNVFNTGRYGFVDAVWPDGPDRTDNYGGIIWHAPANMKLKMRFAESGTDPMSGIMAWGCELVTPETETTCHYFWSFCRDFRLNDDQLDDLLFTQITRIFTHEDGAMIADVQANMGEETDLVAMRPVILPTDQAAIRARRIVRSLLRREQDAKALVPEPMLAAVS